MRDLLYKKLVDKEVEKQDLASVFMHFVSHKAVSGADFTLLETKVKEQLDLFLIKTDLRQVKSC